ncbi:MAG: hypothetical protein A3F33_02290 [Candidatus Woykebacteria bacterium RIFCSPHIGHO2_12_FULL_43_10]|uniref:ComEC/Rec2-related protein domain-containing protein n=2 Tax=Candidatus Woykeibacteriota TaxID=1817899 RepID=A0A1G1WY61_9BACT|nr:MAG: hypothetical protein A2802_02705 [Candidatus Woykebacteria bacterium RIFCSPHIGHO2_01_FULL_43_29]OGY29826.1 MAG: hypothetical protein A3J50_04420 [Candidatus Woykebacteria bacterium RIFCSPHIGHO2_02_FULL_43_16b]OGY30494.1 MAG: hypothetical protein A3F33_02290 [Candidatus Woykebacteria bacterium RIFCSPHIGHO2_12_FULL_43_10]OGY32655.1 MAG: hypothetical protein A3A61_04160 [Candidatus Woykebacteria bacterium RIFCSPLOWO2_01_FULL_43_14]
MQEFLQWLEVLREQLIQNTQVLLPEPHASLLSGIVLGEKGDLSSEFKKALIATGTIHVVVVSGYNISLICGWLSGMTRIFSKQITFVLIISCVIFYTLLTGAEAPTIRAAIMGLLVWGSRVAGRVSDSVFLLILTGVVMFVFDHTVLESISFQLSFMATLGIILFGDTLGAVFKFLPSPLSSDLATTLSAQILVLPILVYYFGSVSWISPVVNVLVLWTVPLATILGFLTLLISILSMEIAKVAAWFVWLPLDIFQQIISISGSFSYSQIYFPKQNVLLLVGWYFVILGFLSFRKKHANELADKT